MKKRFPYIEPAQDYIVLNGALSCILTKILYNILKQEKQSIPELNPITHIGSIFLGLRFLLYVHIYVLM